MIARSEAIAMVAAAIANMSRGDFHGNQYRQVSANLPIPPVSQKQAAKMLNVSDRTVRPKAEIET